MYEPAIELGGADLKNGMGTTGVVPSVVSLFAGCGGSSTGYKMAGCQVRAAVEWEQNSVDTYRLNHPKTTIFHRDIATVTGQELLEATHLQIGELDILDGSPPCQGFSTVGKRQLDDPPTCGTCYLNGRCFRHDGQYQEKGVSTRRAGLLLRQCSVCI